MTHNVDPRLHNQNLIGSASYTFLNTLTSNFPHKTIPERENRFTSPHTTIAKLKLIKFVRLPFVTECFNPYGAIGLCNIGVCAIGLNPMGLGKIVAKK